MKKQDNKTPRAHQVRSESERPKAWVNSSHLDAPECPAGYGKWNPLSNELLQTRLGVLRYAGSI